MSLGWLRCIPLQLVLATLVVEMSVAQMLKLQISVAVAAGADNHIILPYFKCCLKALHPHF